MTWPLLGGAVLLAVAAFLTWERHRMARTLIEADLQQAGATDARITVAWGECDRHTWTCNVNYVDAAGREVRTRCRIPLYADVERRAYWADLPGSRTLQANAGDAPPVSDARRCPNCEGTTLYAASTNANGGYGPSLLPGLGKLFRPAQLRVVACADCGLVRLFADAAERERLAEDASWTRL